MDIEHSKHSEYLKDVEHNYSVRGESSEIGHMPTANHQHGNSIKVKEQKRRKYERKLRHILESREALERFNEILDQMKIRLDELEERINQSLLAQKLILSRDIEGSVEFLIQYHNLDPLDLAVMSSDEIMGVMMNLETQNQDSIAQLKSEIKVLAHEAYLIMGGHFDADNPQHQKLMNRLDAMESRAQKLDTDFDKVLENAHFETGNTYTLLKVKIDSDEIKEDNNISTLFNFLSNSDQSLNKHHEQGFQNQTVQKPIGMNL